MAGIAFGQTLTGCLNRIVISSDYVGAARYFSVGTTLGDGSTLICKAGGVGWFVAPASTEIAREWSGPYGSGVGNRPCISDWSPLGTCLSNAIGSNYVATQWFVPSSSQLLNPGYCCRSKWAYSNGAYWSATESDGFFANALDFSTGTQFTCYKFSGFGVRAFRCVTY